MVAPRASNPRSAATSTSPSPRRGRCCCWTRCSRRRTPRSRGQRSDARGVLLMRAETMLAALARTTASLVSVAAAGAAAGCAQAPAGAVDAASAQTSATAPLIREGPGGRSALASWTLALDSSDRGLATGWQRGGFQGRSVSVPNVVDATDVKGAAGWRNYEGSVAWYRTTFSAPSAGTYALSFASANFRARVFVDGRALAAHVGSYLP